jgi:methylglutaconyl-CoA hydratase
MAYQYLTTKREGPVEYLTLNRPEVRNAFNEEVIAELMDWATQLGQRAARDGVRVAVLAGSGKSFCAGAGVDGEDSELHRARESSGRD